MPLSATNADTHRQLGACSNHSVTAGVFGIPDYVADQPRVGRLRAVRVHELARLRHVWAQRRNQNPAKQVKRPVRGGLFRREATLEHRRTKAGAAVAFLILNLPVALR